MKKEGAIRTNGSNRGIKKLVRKGTRLHWVTYPVETTSLKYLREGIPYET